jgi:hypothetical protein
MISRDFRLIATGFLLGAFLASSLFLFHHFLFTTRPPVDSTGFAGSSPSGFQVYLAGDVHQQGAVEIRPGEKVTVSQAIALDGGLADFGDQRSIRLIRKQLDGTSKVIPVDLKISQLGGVNDPFVQAEDVINVPQRQIAW